MTKKIWYLDHGLSDYKEDVKSLAKSAGLLLVDGRITQDRTNETLDPPKTTLKTNQTEGKKNPKEEQPSE